MKLKVTSLFLAASLGFVSIPSANAVTPFTIQDIRVEGVQRTDPGTVFNYLPIRVGEKFDDDKATLSIKKLFATGFFNDVRIETSGNVVIVTVSERPTIADIDISGASAFSAKQITEMLKAQRFSTAQIYDQSILEKAIQELKNQYHAQGRYAVEIKTALTKLERNRVGVKISIDEGDIARIKKINILGAKAFKESKLRDVISSTEPGWMSWYTKTDQYSKQKLEADVEALQNFYLDRGYLEFDVLSKHVNLSENKKEVFITINIHEGEQYKIRDIRFAGNLVLPEEEVRKLVTIKSGEIFARDKLNTSILNITERLGNEGYASANVNVVPENNKEKHSVSLVFYVEPHLKTYVRRINIAGNKKTRDEVVRRELRQVESALYATDKIKRSKERIDQLGYFSNVSVETVRVPDTPDTVDLNINVTESSTGSFQMGVGYGQSEGIALVGSLSQNNFLGSGNQFSAQVNTSKSNKLYSFQLLNPYATADGVSLGWSIFRRDYKPEDIDLGKYHTNSWGGGVTVGLPISEYNRINFGLNIESLKLHTNPSTPTYIKDFVSRHGQKNTTYTASVGWGYTTLDSAFYPTSGLVTSLGAEVAIPPTSLKYYKLNASNKLFIPMSKLTSLMWNIDVGYGKSYGNNVEPGLPFYQNYLAGGVNSVRGYQTGSLSVVDNNGDSIGGNRRLVNNFELLFPVPGLKDDRATRLSLFLDSGYVFSPNQKIRFSELRHSTGLALTWISPIGPIKLSYALPLKKKQGDKIERFQFLLGTTF